MLAWLNQPYANMSDAELFRALHYWAESVRTAPGWSSAYYSATALAAICTEGDKRGLGLTNPYPIKVG